MPRGGKKGHKGRGKQFSNPEEIDRQMRAQKEMEENAGAEKESSSESEEESSSDDESGSRKRSGVEGLIEIENPNRASQKSKKVTELDVSAPRELSRREREEIEKQKSKERYMKLHLEGKTEQARADLARLAIIKKQREEAAKKRDELRKEKKPKKPKQSASPPSESFIMHFSLRGMEREGGLEEENREGTNMSGVRSGVLLNSCPSFQIRGAWVFHDSVVRTGKTGGEI